MKNNTYGHMQKLANKLVVVFLLFFSSVIMINAEENLLSKVKDINVEENLLPKTKVVNGEEFVLLIHQTWDFDINEFLEQNPRYWAYSRAVRWD